MKKQSLRSILLLFAFLTSPMILCSVAVTLSALDVDFGLNFFEAKAKIENKTSEMLYITPITTSTGDPDIITQAGSIRQRDFPLEPNKFLILKYDSADVPLTGIIVCRAENNCRYVDHTASNFNMQENSYIYQIRSYENLPVLEPEWLSLIQSYPQNNYGDVVIFMIGLLPIFLFGFWLFLSRYQQQSNIK